jgi:opacity protein-like surface antigen
MRKLFLLLTCMFVIAPLSFAQSDKRAEVFIGYSNLQAEGLPNPNGPSAFLTNFFERRTTLHGVDAEVTGFPSKRFGITGDFSFNRKDRSFTGLDSIKTDVYYFMAGPSVKFRNAGRIEPFARVMAGGAHTHFDVSAQITVAGRSVGTSFDTGSTDFAMAVGGGLDVRLGDKFSVRVFQVDYAPVFLRDRSLSVLGAAGALLPFTLESQRQDNVRFGVGLVF